jgi:hypothetical protein
MNNPFLFILLTACLANSCSLFDRDEELPAFLTISEFDLEVGPFQGSSSSNITEVMVSIDGNTLGLFELPATIPVLANGTKEVLFSAIIKQNGVSADRVSYPLYRSFTTEVKFWTEEFTSSIDFEESEASEGRLILVSEELAFDDPTPGISGNPSSAFIELESEENYFFAETEESFELPFGQPVFVELDYASNHPFTIGARASVQTAEAIDDLVIILPSSQTEQVWKKIYINVTNFVAENSGATEFEIYVKLNRSDSYPDPEVYLDNVKVIY